VSLASAVEANFVQCPNVEVLAALTVGQNSPDLPQVILADAFSACV
jgi:hypothetical protein